MQECAVALPGSPVFPWRVGGSSSVPKVIVVQCPGKAQRCFQAQQPLGSLPDSELAGLRQTVWVLLLRRGVGRAHD